MSANPPPGTRSPFGYAAVFAIYAVAMTAASESDAWGDAAAALAWLVFLGAAVYWWNPLAQNLNALLGSSTPGAQASH